MFHTSNFIGLISIQPPLCLRPSRLAILTPVNLFAFYYDDRAVHFIRKIGSKHQHVQSTPDAIAGDGSGETFVQKLIRLKAYLYIINARKSVHDILQRFFVEIQISLYPLNVIFGIHFCGSQLLGKLIVFQLVAGKSLVCDIPWAYTPTLPSCNTTTMSSSSS